MKLAVESSCKMANMSFACACLIVLLHCTPAPIAGSGAWWYTHFLGREGICSIAVPYFFLASGFFLAGKTDEVGWWRREVLKRVKSLVVPFFVWLLFYQAFGLCLWFFKCRVFHQAATNPWLTDPMAQLLAMTGLHPFKDLGVLWFVRCLFALVLFSPAWLWLLRRSKVMVLLLLAVSYVVVSWQFGRTGWDFYSLFDRFASLRGTFYFVLGMALRLSNREWRVPPWGIALCGCCVVILLAARNIACLGGNFPLYNVLEPLAVPCLMLAVFAVMPARPWPGFLTGNAFAIFLMHNVFLSLAAMGFMVLRLHDNPAWQIPMMYVRFVLAVGASIAAATCLRRKFPRFAALVFGGR